MCWLIICQNSFLESDSKLTLLIYRCMHRTPQCNETCLCQRKDKYILNSGFIISWGFAIMSASRRKVQRITGKYTAASSNEDVVQTKNVQKKCARHKMILQWEPRNCTNWPLSRRFGALFRSKCSNPRFSVYCPLNALPRKSCLFLDLRHKTSNGGPYIINSQIYLLGLFALEHLLNFSKFHHFHLYPTAVECLLSLLLCHKFLQITE